MFLFHYICVMYCFYDYLGDTLIFFFEMFLKHCYIVFISELFSFKNTRLRVLCYPFVRCINFKTITLFLCLTTFYMKRILFKTLCQTFWKVSFPNRISHFITHDVLFLGTQQSAVCKFSNTNSSFSTTTSTIC